MIDRGLFEAQAVPGRLNFLMRRRKARSSRLGEQLRRETGENVRESIKAQCSEGNVKVYDIRQQRGEPRAS